MNKDNYLKVVVAEDEYMVLMGIKEMVQELGHEIIGEATNGKKAVEITLKEKPDLLIIDINMPVLDGIDAIKKINELYPMPSIVVTGYYNKELIDRAKKAGAFSYLVKPIDEKDLQPAIEMANARFEEFLTLRKELQETQAALEARKYIEKAKGILMDKYNIKESQAMKTLQKKSRNNNKKLVVTAKEIIKADKLLQIDE
ncbi:MAG: response regulator [Firmicutes bacterium]|nr:response regulator [Bacillota bacterium]